MSKSAMRNTKSNETEQGKNSVSLAWDGLTEVKEKISKRKERSLRPLRSALIVSQGTQGDAFVPAQQRKKKLSSNRTKRNGKKEGFHVIDTNDATTSEKNAIDTTRRDPWTQSEEVDDIKRAEKFRKRSKRSKIASVQVDAPGCAINPEYEAHQDALGQAVAEIMVKEYRQELKPVRPIAIVKPEEIERQLVEEDAVDDGFMDETDSDEEENKDSEQAIKTKKNTRKKTRADINRKRRHKERLREEEKFRAERKQKTAMNNIQKVNQEVEEELQGRERRRIRTMTAREERRQRVPARLGKIKYVPEPTQVLLTEEVTGSLRKTRGVTNLIRDRFKSLQQRELIEPTKKQPKLRLKRKVVERGSRGEAAREAAGVAAW